MNASRTPRTAPGRRAGFTIIEIIVATGISILLMALLISIVTNVTGAWSRTTGSLQVNNQGRMILDKLTEDLQNAVIRPDGRLYLAASIQAVQVNPGFAQIPTADYDIGKPVATNPFSVINRFSYNITPASLSLEDYRFGHVGVWLRFFTRSPQTSADATGANGIRAVGYQMARVALGTDTNDSRYILMRSEVSNANTALTGVDLSLPQYNAVGGVLGDPGNLRRPVKVDDYIGVNVIDFGVRIYARDSSGNEIMVFPNDNPIVNPIAVNRTFRSYLATSVLPAPIPYPVSPPSPSAIDPYAFTPPSIAVRAAVNWGMPSSIEVMVRILTPEGAEKILALEKGFIQPPGGAATYPEYWWELALQNSKVFTRKITLPATSF